MVLKSGRRVLHACTLMVGLMLTSTLLAHLCNNIYRTPERVIVKPEKQSVTLKDTDQFRVFVQNNYPTFLHNVRLSVKPSIESVKVIVEPDVFKVLKPGERTSFRVTISAPPRTPRGRYALTFGISAREIGFRPAERPSIEQLRQVVLKERRARWYTAGSGILAAETLARHGDKIGIDYLLHIINQPGGGHIRDMRGRCIRALGSANCREQIPFLKQLLSHRDGWMRGNALLSLGMLKAERNTIQKFVKERDRFVRTCALTALAMHKDESVKPSLEQLINDRDAYVRVVSAWGLIAIGEKDAVKVLDEVLS
ncbi:MAG TPA: hypothetical protein EYP10_13610, partial [Armatimonadetes bacterium]|nr:hypothetical protein [Armatimonadota bacterium]